MSKKARLISIISVIFVAGAGLYLVGCDADTTGPTEPGVSYLPQTFSLAVADGSASNDGFDHNGVAVITLDWNNASPGANVVAPAYVYEYADQPYPRVDGALIGDATTWAQAPETVLTLNNVYGNGGIATIRIKSVYTFVNPPRIWFLLQWDDNGTGQENPGYLGNHWEVVQKSGSASDWWEPLWNDNEDWVAFMWDTWRKVPPDEGSRDFYFTSTTYGFQNNGCTVTCHESDANPHHTNGPNQICDLWMWTGTRTNYTANLTNWASGMNDPAFLFDCYIDQTGFGWGTNNSFLDADDELVEWLVFDEGGAPYLINFKPAVGYPAYGSVNDPGANERYLWLSDESAREMGIIGDPPPISPTDERWEIGDMVAGYVHRTALGSAADVHGRGAWVEANGVGTWTLEVRRNIGATYDEINNDEDVFLGIFEAHPDE